MNGLRHFLLALQFFTRIPVTGALANWVGYSPAMLRESAGHFPGVGWVVGAVGALVFGLALKLLPGQAGIFAAALLCVIATVYLTGAFHEDGLADVADGLGGGRERERTLEIMRDSRIGAFGAIALVLALGLKVALLAVLAERNEWGSACLAVLSAHVLSRTAPLFVMRSLPYAAGEAGKSKPLADAVSGASFVIGLCWAMPALVLVAWTQGLTALLSVCALVACVTAWAGWRFARRLQGFTGDCLGAVQQLSELAVYLALAAQW